MPRWLVTEWVRHRKWLKTPENWAYEIKENYGTLRPDADPGPGDSRHAPAAVDQPGGAVPPQGIRGPVEADCQPEGHPRQREEADERD